ncbi:MAG: class I SAM-dependent methyltransferase [Planctomycetaceae bacterium]|nr:MAG: class I SAM-dependent methyltransferase [Planctomycetaceae bacterium]
MLVSQRFHGLAVVWVLLLMLAGRMLPVTAAETLSGEFQSASRPQPSLPESFGLPALDQGPLEVRRIQAYEDHARFTYVVAEAMSGAATIVRRTVSFHPGTYLVDDLLHLPADAEPIEYHIPAEAAERVAQWRSYLVDGCAELLPQDAPGRIGPQEGEAELRTPPEGVETPARRRVVHVLQLIGEGVPGELPAVELRVENGDLHVELSSDQHRMRLVLPPADLEAGEIAVTAADGKELRPQRPLPLGVLPWGEEGRKLLERWDSAYREGRRPGWDIGRPASQLVEAVESGALRPGRIIELGCGLGSDAIYLAQQGFDVTAIDIAATALARAREKAEAAGLRIRWVLADVVRPPNLPPFDYVYDRGCYHGLRRQHAAGYVEVLARLSQPGTRILILAGSDKDQREGGPPQVKEEEIRGDFTDRFQIVDLRETRFDTRDASAQGATAWLILLERKPDGSSCSCGAEEQD